ncbi:hypothetical protein HERIO_1533 [Hepatospora eriocheir]|uniref:GOLD domain-containing protein n=1 Tax=Hepatospora eriocheir TaxID=1081669 RepID=A0A1X0Q9R1_9MICR|nr:hypothetical protein HERIO_1533 [Hepatospora eriocheir]
MFLRLVKLLNAYMSIGNELRPNQKREYVEEVSSGERFTFMLQSLDYNSDIRVTIYEPNKQENYPKNSESMLSEMSNYYEDQSTVFNDFKKSKEIVNVKVNKDKPFERVFKKRGKYYIRIDNLGVNKASFTLASHVAKLFNRNEKNKDANELRHVLESISQAMEDLRIQNFQLNNQHRTSLKEARNILWMINLLILFPILTIAVGVTRHYMAKYMVMPKKQRKIGHKFK